MLQPFDWVRKSRTGAELIATIRYLSEISGIYEQSMPNLGTPVSALDRPCIRCWLYERESGYNYCRICQRILIYASRSRDASLNSAVLWAAVNHIPDMVTNANTRSSKTTYSTFIHPDNKRFLILIHRLSLMQWFMDLFVYHGDEIKGLFQIFPTIGATSRCTMGDLIVRAAYYDSYFPHDMLRVRFFYSPFDLLNPSQREAKGMLTFEIKDFFRMMESASIFRTLIKPQEQDILLQLAKLEDINEERFYWGRIMGLLSPEAKDMLTAWDFRQWPASRIRLLYELLNYVPFKA